eukprot:gene9842-6914_t
MHNKKNSSKHVEGGNHPIVINITIHLWAVEYPPLSVPFRSYHSSFSSWKPQHGPPPPLTPFSLFHLFILRPSKKHTGSRMTSDPTNSAVPTLTPADGAAAPPPQDHLVGRQFVNGVDGREAVAAADIPAGDLVLVAAPFALAMFTGTTPSGLVCAAKAVSDAAAETAGEGKVHGRYKKNHQSSIKKKPTTQQQQPESRHLDAHQGDPSAMMDASRQFGLTSETNAYRAGVPLGGTAIPSGTRLLNRDRLQTTAIDISVEQILLQRERQAQEEAQAAAKQQQQQRKEDEKEPLDSENGAADGEEEVAVGAALTPQQLKALKKQKKPAKSAAMRKDGVVALKQRLAASAAEELELFVETYRMEKGKRDRQLRQQERAKEVVCCTGPPPAAGELEDCGTYWLGRIASIPSWDTGNDNDNDEDEDADGCAGCEHCGVLVYCSRRCWRSHKEQHRTTGECLALRRMYFPLMQHYFAPSAKSMSHAGVGGNVGLVPGSEPSRWTARCGAERELEMHSLLLAGLVAAAAAAQGKGDRLRDGETVHVQTPEGGESSPQTHTRREAKEDGSATNTSQSNGAPTHLLAATTPAAAAVVAQSSMVQPKEVITIEALRRSLDAAPAVEVMDAHPNASQKTDLTETRKTVDDHAAAAPSPLREISWPLSEDVGFFSCCAAGEDKKEDERRPTTEEAPAQPELNGIHRQQVRGPSYADAALLVTNLSVLPKDRHSWHRCAWRQYLKLVAPLLAFRLPLSPKKETNNVPLDATTETTTNREQESTDVGAAGGGLWLSSSYFNRIGAACQCNSFGVFSPGDECIASGLYPEASFFNHSCAPNLCRVMRCGRTACFYALRRIAAGESLTISYTDVQEDNTAERRRLLLHGYRFFCHCARCSGVRSPDPLRSREGDTTATATTTAFGSKQEVGFMEVRCGPTVIRLCGECDAKGYLRPLRHAAPPPTTNSGPATPPPAAAAAAAVVEEMCSVCRRRGTRPAPVSVAGEGAWPYDDRAKTHKLFSVARASPPYLYTYTRIQNFSKKDVLVSSSLFPYSILLSFFFGIWNAATSPSQTGTHTHTSTNHHFIQIEGRTVLRKDLRCWRPAVIFSTSPLLQPAPRGTARPRRRRTSWRLPDVRLPGGSGRHSTDLANLEQRLACRTANDVAATQNQLGSGHLGNNGAAGRANTAGKLALIREAMQDPLFTPQHRQPGFTADAQSLISRPGGRRNGLHDPRRTWHTEPTDIRRLRQRDESAANATDNNWAGVAIAAPSTPMPSGDGTTTAKEGIRPPPRANTSTRTCHRFFSMTNNPALIRHAYPLCSIAFQNSSPSLLLGEPPLPTHESLHQSYPQAFAGLRCPPPPAPLHCCADAVCMKHILLPPPPPFSPSLSHAPLCVSPLLVAGNPHIVYPIWIAK